MKLVKVAGKNNKHRVLLYALSTCGHCSATKQFLKDNDVEFEYIDVDHCDSNDLQEIKKDILNRKSDFAFPKIIVDSETLITGFDKEKIKKSIEI